MVLKPCWKITQVTILGAHSSLSKRLARRVFQRIIDGTAIVISDSYPNDWIRDALIESGYWNSVPFHSFRHPKSGGTNTAIV